MARYNRMAMTKHATLSAVLLMGLLTAACTSASGVSLGPTASRPTGSAVATSSPTAGPEALTSAQPALAPTQQQQLARPSLGPNRCPPITANPVGCPASLPPQPIGPQTGHARILLCQQAIVGAAPPILRAAVLCGTGFRPAELVTIAVIGRLGNTSWQVTARVDGTFRSGLPTAACRLMPSYATARGNRGSVSNAVPLGVTACYP